MYLNGGKSYKRHWWSETCLGFKNNFNWFHQKQKEAEWARVTELIKAAIMRNVEEKWVFGVYVLVFGIKYNQHEENKWNSNKTITLKREDFKYQAS